MKMIGKTMMVEPTIVLAREVMVLKEFSVAGEMLILLLSELVCSVL